LLVVAVHYGSYPRADIYLYRVVDWASNLRAFFFESPNDTNYYNSTVCSDGRHPWWQSVHGTFPSSFSALLEQQPTPPDYRGGRASPAVPATAGTMFRLR